MREAGALRHGRNGGELSGLEEGAHRLRSREIGKDEVEVLASDGYVPVSHVVARHGSDDREVEVEVEVEALMKVLVLVLVLVPELDLTLGIDPVQLEEDSCWCVMGLVGVLDDTASPEVALLEQFVGLSFLSLVVAQKR